MLKKEIAKCLIHKDPGLRHLPCFGHLSNNTDNLITVDCGHHEVISNKTFTTERELFQMNAVYI